MAPDPSGLYGGSFVWDHVDLKFSFLPYPLRTPQALALAFDLDLFRLLQEAVQDGRGCRNITKEFPQSWSGRLLVIIVLFSS